MAKVSPLEFVQQIRRELARVTWPSRRETTISTVMVIVFVVLAALFFMAVDQVISVLIRLILGLGG